MQFKASLHAAQTDVVVHQQLIVFLNGLLRQPLSHVDNGLIVLILPEP